MRETDTQREVRDPLEEFDREKDRQRRTIGRRGGENETEAERDNQSGHEPYLKPEQPW